MKNLFINRVGLLPLVAASLSLCCLVGRPALGQDCPITLPASPGNNLTSYITSYPYFNSGSSAGIQQQLISLLLVDVTNVVNSTNYSNPPIPYGLYPTWCVDDQDPINPVQGTVPGGIFTGALYSTCDPNLNEELPPGHPGTLVSSTNWQMVNYLLNHQQIDGTNAFYWDVQAAINTLVGPDTGSTPVPDGGTSGYPTYQSNVVYTLLTNASNNAAKWVPQCGNVYGVIYVTLPTNNQFILLEVPVTGNNVLLVKTGPATAVCGSNITYNFAVTNTGCDTVTLSVYDPMLGGKLVSSNSVPPGVGFTFTKTYTTESSNIGKMTNTAYAVATPSKGPSVTNYSSAVTDVTTQPQTCSITCAPNWISGNCYLWCNASVSASLNCAGTLYCKNATITVNCYGGKSYTCPVPDSQICFNPCATSAGNCYDGSKWCTTVPSCGDTGIFLAGCGIAPNANFSQCESITWTGTFCSDTPGQFNWQFGASCYNTDCTKYSSLCVKSCDNTPCQYGNNGGQNGNNWGQNGCNYNDQGDQCGTLENCKNNCSGGGCNSGSGNCKLNPCQ